MRMSLHMHDATRLSLITLTDNFLHYVDAKPILAEIQLKYGKMQVRPGHTSGWPTSSTLGVCRGLGSSATVRVT